VVQPRTFLGDLWRTQAARGAGATAQGVVGGLGGGLLVGDIAGQVWSGTRLGSSTWGSAATGFGTVLAGAAAGAQYGPLGALIGAITAPATALYRYGMRTRRQRLEGEAATAEVAAHQASLYGLSAEAWQGMTDEQRLRYVRGHRTALSAAPQQPPWYEQASAWLRHTFDEDRLRQAIREGFEAAKPKFELESKTQVRFDPPEFARAIELYEAERNIRAVYAALS
jgi:hypothetical protein